MTHALWWHVLTHSPFTLFPFQVTSTKLLLFLRKCNNNLSVLHRSRPETFYPKSGFDPKSDPDSLQKFGYTERPNPDPDSKILDPSRLDLDPDILILSPDIQIRKFY